MRLLSLVPWSLGFPADVKVDWSKRWLTQAFIISTLLSLLLAAHQVNIPPGANLVLTAIYWWVRLSMAFVLFTGGILLLESTRLIWFIGWKSCALIAFFLTLPVFVMFVTMLDLSVGLPELGSSLETKAASGVFWELAWEIFYLSDNYAIYCVMMSVPRWWNERFAKVVLNTPLTIETPANSSDLGAGTLPTFLQHTNPRLQGRLQLIEAQEHYIRIETSNGATTALYRFGDALRDLRDHAGMQVHRSFWVADDAVTSIRKTKHGTRLSLTDGREIPVSRRFEIQALARYSEALPPNPA